MGFIFEGHPIAWSEAAYSQRAEKMNAMLSASALWFQNQKP
jgi:hypothetical protein